MAKRSRFTKGAVAAALICVLLPAATGTASATPPQCGEAGYSVTLSTGARSATVNYTGVERYISEPTLPTIHYWPDQHVLYYMAIGEDSPLCVGGVCDAQVGFGVGSWDGKSPTAWTSYFEANIPNYSTTQLINYNDGAVQANGFYNVFFTGGYLYGYPVFQADANGVDQGDALLSGTTGYAAAILEENNYNYVGSCPNPGNQYFGTTGAGAWNTGTQLNVATTAAPNNWGPWTNGQAVGDVPYHVYFLNPTPPYSQLAFKTDYEG